MVGVRNLQTLGCKMTAAGSKGEVTSMCRWAERAGWPAIADAVRACRWRL